MKYLALFFSFILLYSAAPIFATESVAESGNAANNATESAAGNITENVAKNTTNGTAKNTTKKLTENNGDYVVLLHGIARSSKQMDKLEAYLQKQGYDVINISYPSTDYTLDELTDIIYNDITRNVDEDKPVHFVGFSMGGLLTRAIIHKHKPKNLGRVVQLAAPNNGSEVTDFLKQDWFYKAIFGPAGQQLTTDQQKIKHLFGEIYYELGIIAGNNTIDPLSSIIIPGDDDGKVSIKSTKLKGMKEHIVVSSSHTFFPYNKTVHRQTAYFLKNGVFKKDSKE